MIAAAKDTLTDERRRILEMVAQGKIGAEDAERLLSAMAGDRGTRDEPSRGQAAPDSPRAQAQDEADECADPFGEGFAKFGEEMGKMGREMGNMGMGMGDMGAQIGARVGEWAAHFAERMAWRGCDMGGKHKGWRMESDTLTFPAEGLDRVELVAGNGAIKIVGSSGADQVRVRYTKEAKGAGKADAEEAINALRVDATTEGSTLRLGHSWATEKKEAWEGGVKFDITLPPGLALAIEAHNGPLSVTDHDGELFAKIHNGPIRVTGGTGSARIEGGNGPVRLGDRTGNVELETGNGPITIDGVNGDLQLKAGNGPISVKGHNGPSLRVSSGHGPAGISTTGSDLEVQGGHGPLRLELLASGPVNGSVSTGNGPVSIRLGDGVSTRLTCKTTGGPIGVKRGEVTNRGDNSLEATVGEGEGTLSVRSEAGPISIK